MKGGLDPELLARGLFAFAHLVDEVRRDPNPRRAAVLRGARALGATLEHTNPDLFHALRRVYYQFRPTR